MKKFSLSVLFCFMVSLVFGQQQVKPEIDFQNARACYAAGAFKPAYKTMACIDTLNEHQQRTTIGYQIYGVTSGGYVFGTANDGNGDLATTATGIYFDAMGIVKVIEVFAWVGAKKIVGAADNLKLEIYNAGTDSLPTNLVGFGTANMGFVDSSSNVNFNTGLGLARLYIDTGSDTVTNAFVVALNYTGFDDSLGLVSNQDGDGFGEKRTKQLFAGTWAASANYWTNADMDAMIIPIVECTGPASSDPQIFGNTHLQIITPFPSPASQNINLGVIIPESDLVRLSVWDVQGRTVYDSETRKYNAGEHHWNVDVSSLPAGQYYYTLTTSKTRISSRFSVQR